MNKKKLVIIGCIVLAIVIGAVIGYNAWREAKDRAYVRDMCEKIYHAVIDGSAELGISDIEVTRVGRTVDNRGEAVGWYTVCVNSEMFGKLTDEEKLKYFSWLDYEADRSISHYISCRDDKLGGLRITADGHEYFYHSDIGTYTLYKDNELAYENQWGNLDWFREEGNTFLEDFMNGNVQPLEPSGNCYICGKSATNVFQGTNYCHEDYANAVMWAFEKVADKQD
jgi:hypothetical protein